MRTYKYKSQTAYVQTYVMCLRTRIDRHRRQEECEQADRDRRALEDLAALKEAEQAGAEQQALEAAHRDRESARVARLETEKLLQEEEEPRQSRVALLPPLVMPSRACAVTEDKTPPAVQSLSSLQLLEMERRASEEIDMVIQLTDGCLDVFIKYEDTLSVDIGSLVVAGFRESMSNAEMQGLLKIGDRILEVNGVDMRQKRIEDFTTAISSFTPDDLTVSLRVTRHRSDVLLNTAVGSPDLLLTARDVPLLTRRSLESYSSGPDMSLEELHAKPSFQIAPTKRPHLELDLQQLSTLPSYVLQLSVAKTEGYTSQRHSY